MRLIIMLMLLLSVTLQSQVVELSTCIDAAKQKSSLSRQAEYYNKQMQLKNENINSNWLPKINADAQASYQSEVLALPFRIPNISITEIPKEQYRITLSASQMLYDGGASSLIISKNISETNSEILHSEINLDRVKDNVIRHYLTALMLKNSIKITENALKRLDDEKTKLIAIKKSGLATESMINKLDIEIMKVSQKKLNLDTEINSALVTLQELTGLNIQSSLLVPPQINYVNKDNKRRELELFESKKKTLDVAIQSSNINLIPKLMLFAQGGYGAPNPMNMFETNGDFFYIAGIKLNWELWDWNNGGRNTEILEINKQVIQTERENFEQNIQIQSKAIISEIEKYENMLQQDLKIIELQKNVVEERKIQLAGGTTTLFEYLNELNSLTELELNYEIHKMQLLNAGINLQNITGNY